MSYSDIELEKILISSIVFRPDSILEAEEILSGGDLLFSQEIYNRALRLYKAGRLDDTTLMIECGDFKNIVDYITQAPGSIKHIAEEIAERRRKKTIASIFKKALSEISSFNTTEIVPDLIKKINSQIGKTKKDGSAKGVISRFKSIVAEANKTGRYGLQTGFAPMDNKYLAYQPGHLWVIGAWTSTGKTAWMMEAIKRLYWVGNPNIAILSTEMTEEQLVARYLANRTGVSANLILSGKARGRTKEKIEDETAMLEQKNIHIIDDLRNIEDIETFCKKTKIQTGLDIVFIDFIQNVRKKGYRSKYEMMSDIAIDLQALAKACRCTIVCLSQIPTSAAKEDSGILEYKNAGEIAAAADIGAWMTKSKTDPSVILFHVKKNRHGECFYYGLRFEDNYTSLEEVSL